MSLSGVAPRGRLTAAERAREPRLLHVVAWFDGWGQAQGMRPRTYPRLLDASEARAWRDGWAEGKGDPKWGAPADPASTPTREPAVSTPKSMS